MGVPRGHGQYSPRLRIVLKIYTNRQRRQHPVDEQPDDAQTVPPSLHSVGGRRVGLAVQTIGPRSWMPQRLSFRPGLDGHLQLKTTRPGCRYAPQGSRPARHGSRLAVHRPQAIRRSISSESTCVFLRHSSTETTQHIPSTPVPCNHRQRLLAMTAGHTPHPSLRQFHTSRGGIPHFAQGPVGGIGLPAPIVISDDEEDVD